MTKSWSRVAKPRPHMIVIVSGCQNSPPPARFSESGMSPPMVVIVVRKMGLRRNCPAYTTASLMGMPSLCSLLMKSTSTMASFTTMPESATRPIIEDTEKLNPQARSPKVTPTIESGTENRMMSGCMKLLNLNSSMKNMSTNETPNASFRSRIASSRISSSPPN